MEYNINKRPVQSRTTSFTNRNKFERNQPKRKENYWPIAKHEKDKATNYNNQSNVSVFCLRSPIRKQFNFVQVEKLSFSYFKII